MESGKLHIVMLPWLALGHLLPFMELSRRLAAKGHRVSFISTPRNIARLPKLDGDPIIHFVELPLPPSHNLPEYSDASIDLPSDSLRPLLRKSYDSLAATVSSFLLASSPDWLLVDYAAYWAPAAAQASGVRCAFLSLFGPAALSFFGPPAVLKGGRTAPEDFTSVPDWIPFPSTVVYRPYEAEELFAAGGRPDESGVSESFRFGEVIDTCDLVVVRSCPEFESRWLDLLRKILNKPVIPAGFFPPMPHVCPESSISRWLDAQPPRSVVYAAFGSEVKMTEVQVKEIARGLELAGLPFLWAVRAPECFLPEGFQQRVTGRGYVSFDWVPQPSLLGHRSMMGFLTHGGRNSIIEGLKHGLPLVLLPLMFEQGLNSRDLVEKGVGVEVPRDEDGSLLGASIARSIRITMVEEGGEFVRRKARECKEMFGDEELQGSYISLLLQYLVEHKP